ncbi:MAG TPA: single-stranded-DNA-specific exonuclease RecJ [Tepidisphaeraceae bacterium]|jgi:single-stranded-DNA-specific exonuclease
MNRPKRWTIAPVHAAAAELAARLKTSQITAQVLINRGVVDGEECFRFLQPSLKCLHEPGLIANVGKAAGRIAEAIRASEQIVIYGDYDVDGITATAILWHAIRILGGNVDFYIPHRIDEGYGLNTSAINEIIDRGAKLIVTVDCGVTAVEQARIAKERGVDLIVTDHHEWHQAAPPLTDDGVSREPILPKAYTIVHPRLEKDDSGNAAAYPNRNLCGAGVAFKLAWAVGQACNGAARVSDAFRAYLVEATGLAALGTIADVVPLTGENRILARFGLGGLKASKLTGIQALIASAGLSGQTLDSYHVGFLLAPRLNAAGRMGHAKLAAEMLTVADDAKALEIANYLEEQNRERQSVERQICEQAIEMVQQQKMDQEDCRAIVLGSDQWHPGVIGIVASRLVEKFCRPTILVGFNEHGIGQGSGRSIGGFHLAKALEACGEHLQAYGGHEMAAGLKVMPENFEKFRACFCAYAKEHLEPEHLVPELKLDAEAQLRQVTPAMVDELQRLAPFGHGNRRPVFCIKGAELAAPPRRVGKTGDHLQLFVRQGNATMKAIAFNAGVLFDRLVAGVRIDVAFEPTLNTYNGYTNVELEVKDLHFVDA